MRLPSGTGRSGHSNEAMSLMIDNYDSFTG